MDEGRSCLAEAGDSPEDWEDFFKVSTWMEVRAEEEEAASSESESFT